MRRQIARQEWLKLPRNAIPCRDLDRPFGWLLVRVCNPTRNSSVALEAAIPQNEGGAPRAGSLDRGQRKSSISDELKSAGPETAMEGEWPSDRLPGTG